MASALLSIWPLYLVGAAIVFLGFLAFNAWIRGLTGRGSEQPMTLLAASLIAFLVGAATIAITIRIDQTQTTILNTRTFVYHVEVRIRGAAPAQLVLPAPGEPGFFGSLNVTNGTSSMRLNRTATDTNVVLNAAGDVAFDVRAQVVAAVFNGTLTHVVVAAGPSGSSANVTIRMVADGTRTTTVDIVLQVQLIESCGSRSLVLNASVSEGTAAYSGSWTAVVC